MFKNGIMPNDGGWLKQSSKYIKVMGFIDAELTKHQQETAVQNGRK